MESTIKVLILSVVALFIVPIAALGQGEATYKTQCSKCHGMDGSASTPAGKKLGAADLRSQEVQDLPYDELFATIAYGAKHKQYPHGFARRGLEPKQIAELVIYIHKLALKK